MDPPEKPAPPADDLAPLTDTDDDKDDAPVPTGEQTETKAAGAPDDDGDSDPPKRTWRDEPSKLCRHPGCPKGRQKATKFCIAHGGGYRCQHPGCTKSAYTAKPRQFCQKHGGGKKCQHPGCTTCAHDSKPGKFCFKHGGGNPEYRMAKQLKRDAQLRKKHLAAVWERQGKKCANPDKLCPIVAKVDLPLSMVDLDHKVRVADGGDDDPFNLQALCACCHAHKSRQGL